MSGETEDRANSALAADDTSGPGAGVALDGPLAAAAMAADGPAAPDGPMAGLYGIGILGQDVLDLSGLVSSLPAGSDTVLPLLEPAPFDITVTDVVADFNAQHDLVDMSAVLDSLAGPVEPVPVEALPAHPAESPAGTDALIGMAALSGIDTTISIIYDETYAVHPTPVG
jgi:hypothetical protein